MGYNAAMTDGTLKLLLDFDARVQREASQPADFLHRRDRRFALSASEQGAALDARRWLDHLNRFNDDEAEASRGETVARLWRRIASGFALAGAVFGLVTMLGLLVYEGGQRINVTVLMAFVLLQLVFALLTSAQAVLGWQPWRPLLRRFQDPRSSRALRQMQPLLMARAAHLGGLCFATSGLLVLLVALVIQDLAFGWSTTLSTMPERFFALTSALAWPWKALWPAAVPDLALVEATRFYRTGDAVAVVPPARWGDWWPFVMMLWLFYVVLPRAVLLVLTQLHIVARARQLLQVHPGWRALQYRMETPTLDTGNQHSDADDLPGDLTDATLVALPESAVTVVWGSVAEGLLPSLAGWEITPVFRAGGRETLESDRQVLDEVAGLLANDRNQNAILITRGWEPPTGELHDFIAAARERWPQSAHITVVPVAPAPEAPLDRHQLPQWLRLQERAPAGFVSIGRAPAAGVSADGRGALSA